ncbi:MAG: cupredoxin domain-containing protein [Chloroflexi bacterium]|nr:cupredoxin domain-containing protein [Chloroflexota bacterium]
MYKTILAALLILALSACVSETRPASDLTVEMNDFSYTPSSITVAAGELVEMKIKNIGQIEHDFVVERIDVSSVSTEGSGVGEHHMGGNHEEYDLHVSTIAGETSVLKFIPNAPGIYKIFCSVDGHEAAGMIGELIVVSK